MRNVVPRQGTETVFSCLNKRLHIIEKCSSPTGDGNDQKIDNSKYVDAVLRNVVPRQGTETIIDVYSFKFQLRNVVPRQGTETGSYELLRNFRSY